MADMHGAPIEIPSTAVSYDLLSINGTSIPDVKKGSVVVTPMSKYTKYEGEEGNGVIDLINATQIKGTVSYNGLMQTEVQTIWTALHQATFPVCVFEIYNPLNNTTKRFTALIEVGDLPKIIHDIGGNAWGFSFTFEEIDDAPEEDDE